VARIKPALRSAEVHFGHTRNTTSHMRLSIVALMLHAVIQMVNTWSIRKTMAITVIHRMAMAAVE
jgi:hypothetical protein